MRGGLRCAVVLGAATTLVLALAGPGAGQPSTGAEGSLIEGQRAMTAPDIGFPTVVPGAVDPDRYVVGPGDIFQLNLSGRVTRTMWLTVGPEGALFVPGSGAVKLDGLTLTQARREVARKLATEFRQVDVDLRLARVRTMRIFLTGDVTQPGTADVPAVSRASEVLPVAVLAPGASRRNIEVVRRNGERQIADLERFNRTGRDAYNPPLRDGDVIRVPAARRFIAIEGAVSHAGGLELGPSDSLNTLFELAGGPIPAAAGEQCLLLRWKTSTEAESVFFALRQVASGEFNPVLRDGDRAYVYYQPRYHFLEQASIAGEVGRPGTYPLVAEKTRLSDLVKSAGGFLPGADLTAVRLYRALPGSHESDPDFERLLKLSRGEMSESEYDRLSSRLAARHEDFRIDWLRLAKSPEIDLILRGGDVVRVDPTVSAVRVDGEVRRPGIVEYSSRRSIADYIRLAGGYGRRAATNRVVVTRSVTGQTLRASDIGSLAPGDMIWVPPRPDKTLWQNLTGLIAVAAQVATVVFVVRNIQ